MHFFRAHGLGNDYLVLSQPAPLSPARVRAVCDRHRGVGSDGILEPLAPPGSDAPIGLRIHNPDGSLAEKSGNGLRIFAWWLVARQGFPAAFTVWTAGGTVGCVVDGDTVTVDMGAARIVEDAVLAGVPVVRVDLGNPHAVVLGGWADFGGRSWQEVGAALETSVPGRTNVQFVRIVEGVAHIRIWERGAGETLASGSSACAVQSLHTQAQRQSWGLERCSKMRISSSDGSAASASTSSFDCACSTSALISLRVPAPPGVMTTRKSLSAASAAAVGKKR
jgi:diaminopimelate epimerase